jgi:hypothetical protein
MRLAALEDGQQGLTVEVRHNADPLEAEPAVERHRSGHTVDPEADALRSAHSLPPRSKRTDYRMFASRRWSVVIGIGPDRGRNVKRFWRAERIRPC